MIRRAALAALVLLLAPEVWAQWSPQPWEVVCLPDSGLDPSACDDSDSGSAAYIVKSELDAVTPWLHSLGFPEPRIQLGSNGSDYLSYMGPADLFLDDDHVYGYYAPGPKELVVDGSHFIQLEGEDDATGTAPHELFHAVQASYPEYRTQRGHAKWIIEGTAQAVEAAWLTRGSASPLVPGGHAYAYYHRDYSRSIFDTSVDNQEYATSHFWLALGEMLGSESRIAFLADGLSLSDQEPGAFLDALTSGAFPEGFSHVFPRLLARYAADPEHFASNRGRRRVTDGFEEKIDVTIQPLAGAFMRIENAESEMLEVEVEFDDHPSIHFVFGGQQASEIPLNPGPIYTHTLGAGEHVDVLIVNVAPEATDTTAEPIEFTIRARRPDSCNQPPGAAFSVTVTGPREGTGQAAFPFRRSSAHIGGQTRVEYPGLTVFDYGDRKQVVWQQTDEMGLGDRIELARQRLGMRGATDEEVFRAFRAMSMTDIRRVLPELMEDEDDLDAPVIPNSVAATMSTRDGDGSHSILLKNNGSNVVIMMPLSGHYGTGNVHYPGLTIGVSSPVFNGGGREGIQLGNAQVNFSAFEPGLCVAGTFSGAYEGPSGQAHPVTGSFRIIMPEDATVIDMK